MNWKVMVGFGLSAAGLVFSLWKSFKLHERLENLEAVAEAELKYWKGEITLEELGETVRTAEAFEDLRNRFDND